jgi:hypothetical protein
MRKGRFFEQKWVVSQFGIIGFLLSIKKLSHGDTENKYRGGNISAVFSVSPCEMDLELILKLRHYSKMMKKWPFETFSTSQSPEVENREGKINDNPSTH